MIMSFRDQIIAERTQRESHPGGTYVCANVSAKSRTELAKWVTDYGIPNPANPKQYHTTIIYSRKGVPDVKNYKFDLPIKAKITGFDIFMNGDKRCLVAKVDSPELHAHHNAIRSTYGATHDFDDYNPHITLSYDYVGAVPKNVPDLTIVYTTAKIEPLDTEYTA